MEPLEECFIAPPETLEFTDAYDCGFVVVPEDAADPGGPEVKLSFLRFRSRAQTGASPLFLLGGGPGGTQMMPTWFLFMAPGYLGDLLESRDVILLDQRGTAYTEPALDCPDYHRMAWFRHAQGLDDQGVLAKQGEILRGCVAGFEEAGVDLSTFNSVVIASDIDAARRALGYDRIFYYGGSYGSQLGQHLMRDFPEILEGAILDGANSLSRRSWVEDRALDLDYALGHLAGLCSADPACDAAYDIPALLQAGMALFDDGPLEAAYTDPESGEELRFQVRRSDFVSFVYTQMQSKYGVQALPWVLDLVVSGGRETMAQVLAEEIGSDIVSQRDEGGSGIATVMHYAVVCSDDPVRSVDEVVVEPETSTLAREWARAGPGST